MKTLTSFLIICLGALFFAPPGWAAASTAPDTKAAAQALSALSVPFIENSGQIDKEVAFYAKTLGATLFVTKKGEMVYGFPDCTLVERINGLTPDPKGLASSRTKASSFVGNDPSRWRKTLATYKAVSLGEITPGIDVALHAYGGKIEKIITVSPHTDPAFAITLDGASSIDLADTGDLIVHTGKGDLVFSKPVAYQEIEGVRVSVPVAYLPTPAGLSDSDQALTASQAPHAYGFTFGPYDRARPLIIDPVLQSTYLGGNSYDQAGGTALGAEGLYVSGQTYSSDFPGTAGGALTIPRGGLDVFVALLSPDLTELIQSTYLGGSCHEYGWGLALGAAGVYVGGPTCSTDFSGTAGGAQATHGGGYEDGFVALLSPELTEIIQSTYIGGSSLEQGGNPVIGANGVYVRGVTWSYDLPGTAGGAQEAYGGGYEDGFVALFTPNLKTLIQSTYLGGSGHDLPYIVELGAAGVYAVGVTDSRNFPGTAEGAQPVYGGGYEDGFVALLSFDLKSLIRSTYLGGSGEDLAAAPAVAADGIYVTGFTSSHDFPGTAGGAQPAYAGGDGDGYVALLSFDLKSLIQSTFLGGSGKDVAGGKLALGAEGIYVAGETYSSDFPGTAGGIQPYPGGDLDTFVSLLPFDLTSLTQSTYLGGSGRDVVGTLVLGSDGLYAIGCTWWSFDFPGTAGGAQPHPGGGESDGIICLLASDLKLKLVEIISVSTGEDYTLAQAEKGAKAYIDRNYTITKISSRLNGGVLVQTANDDKWVTAEEHLTLRFFKDALVYVCYDKRATTLPPWLRGWKATDQSISTTDSPSSPMKVYWKSVAAGEVITLGGNHAGGDTGARSNYLVVVQPFPVEIMNVSTGEPYALTQAEKGAKAYIDRNFTITRISSRLNGGVLVQTANDDKSVVAEDHLTLRFSKAALVYVGYDKRGSKLPDWLLNWTPTGESISTTDSPSSPMKVYRKSVAAGETITLGGNHAGGDTGARSNYLVVVQPFPVEILNVSTGEPYALSKAETGIKVYIDRSYTITSITSGLNGGALVQTANDDKSVAAEDHLTLRFSKTALVYVCYDNRAATLPPWLKSWTPTGESISTTDSPSSPMKVYRKSVAAGETITLGGNHAGGDTGARSNYLVIVQP